MERIKLGDDVVYLNKGKLGKWRIVYPIMKDNLKLNWKNLKDGKVNWKNLLAGGDWLNLIKIAGIVIIVLGCVYEYSNALNMLNKCLELNSFQLRPWNI